MSCIKSVLILIVSFCSFGVFAQFSSATDIGQANTGASKARAFDMDNDGDEDVLVASSIDHKIAYYQNLGAGNFAVQMILTDRALVATDVFAADLDGDGDLDVLSSSSQNNTIAWYENVGGMFEQEQIISSNVDDAVAVSAADFDGDGDQDVVAASSTSGGDIIIWFENLGGVFGTGQVLYTGSESANCLSSGDIDQDGDIDILYTGDYSLYTRLIENTGGGTFAVATNIIGTGQVSSSSSFSLSDADNDGDLDLLNCFTTSVRISLNDGFGNFSVAGGAFVSGESISASLSDVDGDGDMDITAGITNPVPSNPSKVAFFENVGNFSFGTEQIISNNLRKLTSVYSSDYDNDGDPDLFSTSFDDGKWALYENVGGTLGSQNVLNAITDRFRELRVIDVDFDGDMDVFTAADNVSNICWYENLGGGTFSNRVVISDSAQLTDDVFVADMDQDGDNDVVSLSTELVWYENTGSNNFSIEHYIASVGSSIGISSMHVADFDNDGDNDIAVSVNSNVVYHENLGSGTFNSVSPIIGSSFCSDLHAVDLNGDGFLDILGSEYTNDELTWYENLANGTFGPGQAINVTMDSPLSVHVADLDLDGDMDVLGVSQFGYKVVWHENLGGGVFGPENNIVLGGYAPRSVYASDMDNDGDFDVLVGTNHDVLLLENLGAGVFGPSQVIFADDFYSIGYSAIPRLVAADMDEDGVNDIVALDGLQHSILMFENFQEPPFTLTGKLFYDGNLSSNLEPTDLSMGLSPVSVQPTGDIAFSTPIQDYVFGLDSGTYVVNHNVPDSLWTLTTDSISYTVNLNGLNPSIDSLNFGFYPNTLLTNVNPDLTGAFPRCNQIINYWPSIHNLGSTNPSGVVCLQLDSAITFVSSTFPTDSIIGQNLYWSYDSLSYYGNENFPVLVQMPPFTSMGDTLISSVSVFELDSLGNVLFTNVDTLEQILQCAYDPNDKIVTPQGLGTPGYILSNQDLEYTVRFQNTGTDTALTVIIRDQLDPNLDWNSMYPIASSHPMQTSIEAGGEVVFKFQNIFLPDSNVNEVGSHGFVKFKISQELNLAPSTQIVNQADIYFDFNPAILTNLTLNTIYDCDQISLNATNYTSCVNSGFMISAEDEGFSNYLWQQNSDTLSTLSTLVWTPDSTGTFDLNLTKSNELCQSDTTVSIVVVPEIPETLFNQTVCLGDSALVFGDYESTTGIYIDTLVSSIGCDSVLILDLIVPPVDSTFENEIVCYGDSLLVFGNYETSTGVYVDTVQSVLGCDSILLVNLTALPIISSFQNVSICVGDSLLVSGNYLSSPGIYYDTLQSYTGCDSISAIDLTFTPLLSSTENIEICETDSILIHGNYESASGMYTDTVPSVTGCDSIVTINLSINPLDAAIVNETFYLSANSSAVTYQWLDCDNNSSEILGETNQLFYPTQDGNYTVVIFDGSCYDTADCVAFLNASIFEMGLDDVQLYPNPTTGELQLDFGQEHSDVQVTIKSVLGKEIFSDSWKEVEYVDFRITGASGVYYVDVVLDSGHRFVFKVIKN